MNFLYMWNSSLIHLIYALEKKYYTSGEHREERRKSFLQVGLVLQVKSSFIAQMQTQIISQIQQGTRKNNKKKKNASPDWTRNKEKKEEKKSLVKRSQKSTPLWAAKLLPLLYQITKIDLGFMFGFILGFLGREVRENGVVCRNWSNFFFFF